MREKLLWVKGLTSANVDDKAKILEIHTEVFGNSINVCVNCPDSLRAAVNRLKVEFKNRYE